MTVLEQCYSLLELVGVGSFNRQLFHEVGVCMGFEGMGMGFEGVGVVGQSLLEFGVGMGFEGVRMVGESLLEFGVGVVAVAESLLEFGVGMVGESLFQRRWDDPLLFHSFWNNHYYNYTNLTTVVRTPDKRCYVHFLVREGLRSVLLLGYLSSIWEQVPNLKFEVCSCITLGV